MWQPSDPEAAKLQHRDNAYKLNKYAGIQETQNSHLVLHGSLENQFSVFAFLYTKGMHLSWTSFTYYLICLLTDSFC